MNTQPAFTFRWRSWLGIAVALFLVWGALLGRPLAVIAQDDPKLNAFLVTFMDTMCAQMMAYAIVHLAVVWFALRRGQAWALWTVGAAAVVSFLYFAPIMMTYARFAVPVGESMRNIAIPTLIVLAVTALGWFGLRQTSGNAS